MTRALKQLLLIGGGHAHAQVLRDWITAPVPGVAVTLVSPSPLAPYSGMVPGWLAGTYRYDEICIDLAPLCLAAGVRLIVGEVAALDATARRVRLHNGQPLDYDVLSLNIGSTLHPPAEARATVLSLRPLGALRRAWESTLQRLQGWDLSTPLRITAVGGGAAGAEALLAVCARLRRERPGLALTPRLVTRGPDLLTGLAAGAARALRAALHEAGVQVQTHTPFEATMAQDSDLLLWATGAQAHAWPAAGGLAVDAGGFVAIDPQLRSVSHPQVFAVGDGAGWAQPLPKAGVFAVRMGPVLAHNLRAALTGAPLQTYTPQRRHLVLLATADGRAIATRGRLSLHGRRLGPALWRWKDRIDRRFIARFSPGGLPPPHKPPAS
jgi:pyridine nucleotide-disulfide oxidoreductase family protein